MAAQKNVRIRTEMAKAGINQIELANSLGISDSEVSVILKYGLSKQETDGIISKIREHAMNTA